MSYHVQLGSTSYSVEPGVAVSVVIELKNEGSAPKSIEVSVEGIDPEWVAVPVPVIEVPGGETVTERLFLKPPREPESLSGSYPFVVRTRDQEGGDRAIACSLDVKPFHNVSIDVQPRRGLVSTISPEAVFHVTVMNLGNVEHTVRLFASDAAELFVFEFDQEQVSVSPGAQKSVSMTVTAAKLPLLANARLQQLTVSARSLDDKTVATATHAQVEQRALVTPGLMWLAVLALFIISAAILLWPQNPSVDSFSVTERVVAGQPFVVEWSASHASSVEITVDGVRYGDLRPSGSRSIATEVFTEAEQPGKQIEVKIRALKGRRVSEPKTRLVAVRGIEVPPEPEILEFAIVPTELEVGDSFQVTYSLSDSVTEAVLSPLGVQLDPRDEGIQLTAQVAGEFDYKLTARNQAGQEVEKVIRVQVTEGSDASIIVFRVDPALVDPLDGRVTLTWQVENASRIELLENGRLTQPLLDSDRGEIDRIVSGETTFVLRVFDSQGRTAEKSVTVKTYIPDGQF
jgi:hypothetical protein